MSEFFLTMAALTIGLPVLVACVVLAFFRKTRVFGLPPLVGLAGGAIAALATQDGLAMISFTIVFGMLCVPLAGVLGVVAVIGSVDKRWPHAVPNAFVAAIVVVVSMVVFDALDRPGSDPVRHWTGTVRNLSGVVRPNGVIEERYEVALEDGRRVTATGLNQVNVVSAPSISFPDRLEFERVRVNEYRSVITGRTSYVVAKPGS